MSQIISTDAENALIGGMYVEPDNIGTVISILTPNPIHIHNDLNKYAYNELVNLYTHNIEINPTIFTDRLSKKLSPTQVKNYILTLSQSWQKQNIRDICNVVLGQSLRHYMFAISTKMQQRIYAREDPLDIIEDFNIQINKLTQVAQFEAIEDLNTMASKMSNLLDEGDNPFVHKFITSGYNQLDDILMGGYVQGQMNIIAGRPSMGKTAVLINMAYRMAMQGFNVAFFSLESTKEELLVRLMNLVLNKNIRELIETKPNILKKGLQKLQQLPIFIDDHGNLDIVTLRSRIYQLQHTRKIDVVIIDYLQLMTTKNYDVREREVSELSRQLKIIAKDFKLIVLAAAQLNRAVDARTNKEPMLSDLRESGSIEQDADIVMFVYRDAYYNDTTQNSDAKIIVKKNRTTGGIGTLNLHFTPGIASLTEQKPDIPF